MTAKARNREEVKAAMVSLHEQDALGSGVKKDSLSSNYKASFKLTCTTVHINRLNN